MASKYAVKGYVVSVNKDISWLHWKELAEEGKYELFGLIDFLSCEILKKLNDHAVGDSLFPAALRSVLTRDYRFFSTSTKRHNGATAAQSQHV